MKKIFKRALVFLAAGFMLGACEKNAIPEVTEPVAEGAFVKFFFHVDGAPRTNFFLDSKKVTGVAPTTSGIVLGNLYGSAYPSNAYALLPAGNYKMSAVDTVAGKGTAETLASTSVSLASNKHYSAYLVGTTTSYEVFLAEDKLPPADYTKIWWRFMNTMANMPFAVDVYAVRAAIAATETKPAEPMEIIELGKNLGFKQHGSYVELKPGSYTFKVYPTGTAYDPATTKPYIQNAIVLGTLGRVYTTQIRGAYAETPKTSQIDYWRDR
ncbi:DUF4397 domain-containing protein [Pontibacter sp. JH31]|uniref:DUF4397 domain-containing protein n=1 Tax=Pontibacter aquaedesilientis TaxID=2766980 RepID=A0ABR7XGA5_9BACT|nr:DUF4397 domain-containing protein [Pontibacter aquaedesilientis]MBD1396643.1 DUF4397 domain-containing protein [Pontibacter aquaedesilientis]